MPKYSYRFNNKPVNKQNKRKKEVVFLPYKASMWDSLELVWKKAEKDKNTNAVVIPIPYYDKNPDGSFGELHYEADKFPPDVPIVRYDEYDFATKHPDVIYIHNPYDEGNFVTSVHPFFYSKNLKNYTDELVYIPYFVLNDPDPENENDLKGIENYVMVPAVINATRVIVQSGQMKKAYVEILTRNTRPDMRQFWEKRIEGTGSPKIERVKNLRKEDFLLPKEWERLIYRESCGRKKIIFYNTSISALLKNDEKMLKKIRANMKLFKENREEITLLWRPHPLIEATLKAMRPKLWDEYEAIVDEYIKEGWGIYDDTPNMDRAIAISDAYYGDMSSIVWLYKYTGKPIMIQNCETVEE